MRDGDRERDLDRGGDGDLGDEDRRDDDLDPDVRSFTVFTFSLFLPRPRVGDFFLVEGCDVRLGEWSRPPLGCLAMSARRSLNSERSRALAFCAVRS